MCIVVIHILLLRSTIVLLFLYVYGIVIVVLFCSVVVVQCDCLFVCGFVPYRQLELLAFEGLVPWVIVCVCVGVTLCYSELLRAGVSFSELD